MGAVHGDERAGAAVARGLRRSRPPRGVALWLVDDLNPDGSAAGSRHNARGVDLNRNFPHGWRPGPTHGSAPLSEPESRNTAGLVKRLRPRATIWYHQPLRKVIRSGGDRFLQRLYARRSGLPLRGHMPLPGTAIGWQNRRFRGSTAFVVELAGGVLSPRLRRRHAGAVLALSRAIAPQRIVRRPIPYGAGRKRQMAAYARRHYDIDDWRLRRPRVIVQHYTVTDSFPPVFQLRTPSSASCPASARTT